MLIRDKLISDLKANAQPVGDEIHHSIQSLRRNHCH